MTKAPLAPPVREADDPEYATNLRRRRSPARSVALWSTTTSPSTGSLLRSSSPSCSSPTSTGGRPGRQLRHLRRRVRRPAAGRDVLRHHGRQAGTQVGARHHHLADGRCLGIGGLLPTYETIGIWAPILLVSSACVRASVPARSRPAPQC